MDGAEPHVVGGDGDGPADDADGWPELHRRLVALLIRDRAAGHACLSMADDLEAAGAPPAQALRRALAHTASTRDRSVASD